MSHKWLSDWGNPYFSYEKNYLYLDLLDDLIGELDDHPIDLGHENSPATCGELF